MGLFDWIFGKKKKDYLIEWEDRYSVGIIEIDAQHRRLFEIYNNLIEAMYQGVGVKELGNALNELLEYAVVHFMTEEGYMQKYGYPGYDAHKNVHKEFRERFYGLHKEFHEGKPVLTAEVTEYLRDWLKNHVLNMDQKYAPHLKKAGAR